MSFLKEHGKKIGGGLLLFVLFIGWAGYNEINGSPTGGPCTKSWSCSGYLYGMGGSDCLFLDDGNHYCTKDCSTLGDCPQGFMCETVSVESENGSKVGTESMCVKVQIPQGQILQGQVSGMVPPPQPAQ